MNLPDNASPTMHAGATRKVSDAPLHVSSQTSTFVVGVGILTQAVSAPSGMVQVKAQIHQKEGIMIVID